MHISVSTDPNHFDLGIIGKMTLSIIDTKNTLVKGDDFRSETKANAHYGQLRVSGWIDN